MSAFEHEDQPDFDIVRFEAEAKARADELVAQVSRLAVLAYDDPHEWLAVRGAQYVLADRSQLAVMHETWHGDPEKVAVKIRLKGPAAEGPSLDGQLRRVTLTRFISYESFIDEPTDEQVRMLDEEFPETEETREAEEAFVRWKADLEWQRLDDKMDPDYRPDELISATTTVQVECKLPNSPNFRTERYSDSMPVDTKLAHTAARRWAGEPVERVMYDIAEHKSLIGWMGTVDLDGQTAEPLDQDFEETWCAPDATLRSWMPRD